MRSAPRPRDGERVRRGRPLDLQVLHPARAACCTDVTSAVANTLARFTPSITDLLRPSSLASTTHLDRRTDDVAAVGAAVTNPVDVPPAVTIPAATTRTLIFTATPAHCGHVRTASRPSTVPAPAEAAQPRSGRISGVAIVKPPLASSNPGDAVATRRLLDASAVTSPRLSLTCCPRPDFVSATAAASMSPHADHYLTIGRRLWVGMSASSSQDVYTPTPPATIPGQPASIPHRAERRWQVAVFVNPRAPRCDPEGVQRHPVPPRQRHLHVELFNTGAGSPPPPHHDVVPAGWAFVSAPAAVRLGWHVTWNLARSRRLVRQRAGGHSREPSVYLRQPVHEHGNVTHRADRLVGLGNTGVIRPVGLYDYFYGPTAGGIAGRSGSPTRGVRRPTWTRSSATCTPARPIELARFYQSRVARRSLHRLHRAQQQLIDRPSCAASTTGQLFVTIRPPGDAAIGSRRRRSTACPRESSVSSRVQHPDRRTGCCVYVINSQTTTASLSFRIRLHGDQPDRGDQRRARGGRESGRPRRQSRDDSASIKLVGARATPSPTPSPS